MAAWRDRYFNPAAPGALGGTTPAAGSFTTVAASGAISANGGQIAFPAAQNSSAGANTLDDYEEGSWTPTVSGSSTAGTGTYSGQVGRYTKIGNLVCATAYIAMSGHTGTGDMQLSGLPFASMNVGNYTASPTFGLVNNLALTAGNVLTGFLAANATAISLYQYPTGGGGIAAVPLDTACDIMYTICYHT